MTYMDSDTETKEYISELTDKIREKYNIKTPIQNMTEIVKLKLTQERIDNYAY